jgi:hypothetical protein
MYPECERVKQFKIWIREETYHRNILAIRDDFVSFQQSSLLLAFVLECHDSFVRKMYFYHFAHHVVQVHALMTHCCL